MNFTREPIIETIISPREGCKLLVRSSKSGGPAEEYYVDAVEVVCFGHAFFFRSMERPKAFLVPASDYEVLEVKETRVALKTTTHDRSIKIGGGREASLRHQHRELTPENEPVVAEEGQVGQAQETNSEVATGVRTEKRRDRRRRRHRRPEEEWVDRRATETQQSTQQTQAEGESKIQGGAAEDEAKVSSSMFSSLIPPPTTLISHNLGRYKDKEFVEGSSAKEIEEKKPKKDPPKEEYSGADSASLSRIAMMPTDETVNAPSFTSTHFSPLADGKDSFFF